MNDENIHPDVIASVEAKLNEAERQRYYNKLTLKQKADIRIAEHYIMKCMSLGMSGFVPTSALTKDQLSFLHMQVRKHNKYFAGFDLIGT